MKSQSSPHYDREFGRIKGLAWLPWVGAAMPEMPNRRRILVVGESHYSTVADPISTKRGGDKGFTRRMVEKFAVRRTPTNPTFENIGKVLLGDWPTEHAALWSTLSFYNFVQRSMRSRAERPTPVDWETGWAVFLEVLAVLQPSHCVFIGVESSHAFARMMEQCETSHEPIRQVEKIRRTWARTAKVWLGRRAVGLTFMRHCGQHFCWREWHEFLKTQCATPLSALKRTQARKISHSRRIH